MTKPVITAFTPATGPPGTKIIVSGDNLQGATTVTIGGATAKIKSDTATTLTIKVPSGAKTGKIAVTTPNGKAKSPTKFVVT